MRNSLYFIGLTALVVSCGSQKPVQKVAVKPKTPVSTTKPQPAPAHRQQNQVRSGENFFYRNNIGDVTKNDNTISYGSVVAANPAGFQVVRTYFPAVAQNFRQRYIILHYTALNDEKSAMVLSQQAVSSHYLVNNLGDREIYQLVDENKRAYHAGVSAWRNDKMLNDTSIGIEIVNDGYTVDASGTKIFPEYPEQQIRKVAALVKDIANRYMVPPTNILAHSDIAPTRKQDPGATFPWKKLYDDYQIGMWYDEGTKDVFMSRISPEEFLAQQNNSQFIYKYQTALKTFGYDISGSGVYDDTTKKTVEAFQYHFRPQKYDGLMDAETWAILQALNQKYPNK